jgi:long-chain acyl-CoA synthetase
MYTLGDIPRKGALHFPDRTAVVFEGTRYTYSELNDRINRCAHALLGLGCSKGGHLAIMADNCAKYLEAYFAAAKIGVIVTPINVRLGDDEIVFIVNDSESTVFLVGDGYEERAANLGGRLASVERYITFDNVFPGFDTYEELLAHAQSEELDPDLHDVNEDDLAILMYTGGTTGVPKGVMLSHRNALLSGIAPALQGRMTKEDATCFVLPIFHVSWWPVLAVLLVGGKVCINRRPDLDAIFRLIQDEKCTHLNLVPTIYGWMVNYPTVHQYDLSSVRSFTYAGSPFPVEILKQCIRKFGKRFAQGYGATETAGAAISSLEEDDHFLEGDKVKYLSSAGKPATFSRVKIVDERDNPVGRGEIGEICVRGAHVMKGYWKNPALTAEVLKGGWYHTGDMGYMDRDGYLYLTDRKADVIISGGENVYPKEVEDVIYTHPAVRECAVVSSPAERWGEIVHAVVVLKDGYSATQQEIIDHCKQTLAGYKCPKAVSFWGGLPKTIIGKITKKEVKRTFWDGKERMIG